MELSQLIDRFEQAMRRASEAGLHLPEGATLSTVGPEGQPSSRVVLLKEADERGFVFYTNLESRKSRELSANPRASMCFWWPVLEEQIRVEGRVEQVADDEADEYWTTRPRGSQIGAWASRQSEPLASVDDLERHYNASEKEFDNQDIPRPEFWSGFRLKPERIEFWKGRENRMHLREEYVLRDSVWIERLLSP